MVKEIFTRQTLSLIEGNQMDFRIFFLGFALCPLTGDRSPRVCQAMSHIPEAPTVTMRT